MDIQTMDLLIRTLESKYGWMVECPITPEYVTDEFIAGFKDALNIMQREFIDACDREKNMQAEIINFRPIPLTEEMVIDETLNKKEK